MKVDAAMTSSYPIHEPQYQVTHLDLKEALKNFYDEIIVHLNLKNATDGPQKLDRPISFNPFFSKSKSVRVFQGFRFFNGDNPSGKGIGFILDTENAEVTDVDLKDGNIVGMTFKGTKGVESRIVEWRQNETGQWAKVLRWQDLWDAVQGQADLKINSWQTLRAPVDLTGFYSVNGIFGKLFHFPNGKWPKGLGMGLLYNSESVYITDVETKHGEIVGVRFEAKNSKEKKIADWVLKEETGDWELVQDYQRFWQKIESKATLKKQGWQVLNEPVPFEGYYSPQRGTFQAIFRFADGYQPGQKSRVGKKQWPMTNIKITDLKFEKGQIVGVRFEGVNLIDGKSQISDWVKVSDSLSWSREEPRTREEEIDTLSSKLKENINELMGSLALANSDRQNLAEILFNLFPNQYTSERYKDIDLFELMQGAFFEDLEGQGPRTPASIRYLNPLEITDLLSRLESALSPDGHMNQRLIDFGKNLEMKVWRPRLMKNEEVARGELKELIAKTPTGLYLSVLKAIEAKDDRIQKLEALINRRELLREGLRLSYPQLENLDQMLLKKKVILGDAPGMGKTIEQLLFALLADDGQAKDIVFATGPLNGKNSVERDIEKWLSDKTRQQLEIVRVDNEMDLAGRRDLLASMNMPKEQRTGRIRISLWNYHYFIKPSVQDLLKNARIDVLLFDEAHWLKNEATLRAQASMTPRAPWMVLATGTPVANRFNDLRILLKMVCDVKGETDPQIKKLIPYLEDEAKFNQLFSASNLHRLQYLRQLLLSHMARSDKSVALEGVLPAVREHTLRLDLVNGEMLKDNVRISLKSGGFQKQRQLYEAVYNFIRLKDNARYSLAGINQLRFILSDPQAALMSARKSILKSQEDKVAPSPLMEFIESKGRELDARYGTGWDSIKAYALSYLTKQNKDKKFVVFTNNVESANRYQNQLGEKARTITSSIDVKVRDESRRLLQNDSDEVTAIVGTYGTMSESSDFSAAGVLVLESPYDSRADGVQARGRVLRASDLPGGHPHLKDGVDVLSLVVQDWEGVASADRHYDELNRLKEIIASTLEDGAFTPQLVREFDTLTQKRNQRFLEAMTPGQTLSFEIGKAMLRLIQDDIDGSQQQWNSLAKNYSDWIANLAPHTISVFMFLKLLKLIQLKAVSLPSQGSFGFVPSGPSLDRRAMRQVASVFQENDLPLEGLDVVELDFSEAMLKEGREVLAQSNRKVEQHKVNITEENWPMAKGSLRFLESGSFGTIVNDQINAQGVVNKVWFLSQANKALMKGGILVLSSDHLDFSDALLDNFKVFGFRVVNQEDQTLQMDQKNVEASVVDGFDAQIKKIKSHLRTARVLYLVKERDMDQGVENLKHLNNLDLSLEEEQSRTTQKEAPVANESIELKDFPWAELSIDALKMPNIKLYTTSVVDKDVDLTPEGQQASFDLRELLMRWAHQRSPLQVGGRLMSLERLESEIQSKGKAITEQQEFKDAKRLVHFIIEQYQDQLSLKRKVGISSNDQQRLEFFIKWYQKVEQVLKTDQAMLNSELIDRVSIATRSLQHGKKIFELKKSLTNIRLPLELLLHENQDLVKQISAIDELSEAVRASIASMNKLTTFANLSKEGNSNVDLAREVIQEFERLLKILKEQQIKWDVQIKAHDSLILRQDSDAQEGIVRISDNLNKAIAVLESRLEIATAVKPTQPVAIVDIIKGVQELVPQIVVENHLLSGLEIVGNKLSLISAVSNIAINAKKSAFEKNGELAAKIVMRVKQEGDQIKIEIEDNGAGVSQEKMDIDPQTMMPNLFSLNVTSGGTGLGATEALYAIRDAGGEIFVNNTSSEGTTFAISLPIFKASQDSAMGAVLNDWIPSDEKYPINDFKKVHVLGQQVNKIDLAKLLPGTLIYLQADSWVNYLIRVEDLGRIKLWLDFRDGCFMAPAIRLKRNLKIKLGETLLFPYFRRDKFNRLMDYNKTPENSWPQDFIELRVFVPPLNLGRKVKSVKFSHGFELRVGDRYHWEGPLDSLNEKRVDHDITVTSIVEDPSKRLYELKGVLDNGIEIIDEVNPNDGKNAGYSQAVNSTLSQSFQTIEEFKREFGEFYQFENVAEIVKLILHSSSEDESKSLYLQLSNIFVHFIALQDKNDLSKLRTIAANIQKAVEADLFLGRFLKTNIGKYYFVDKVRIRKGGIDLSSDKALQIKNSGEAIEFHLDPAQLAQLQKAPGFEPVIITIYPLSSLKAFLGIKIPEPNH
ncbi:MAG: hypothetical protein HQL15_04845 [Candidatus Omnitrophica bacterium]|nr:hypothetical protein [Candidatus Omnitrophota bacterium]